MTHGKTAYNRGCRCDDCRAANAAGVRRWYARSALSAVTDAGETTISAALRYDPYGATVATSGSVPTPWRFQGRLDLMSNPVDPLYEWSARYYLPAVGAFSQLDTYAGEVGDPRSLHRYLYAAANPWTLIDPTGHAFTCGADGQCAGSQPSPPINPDTPAPMPQPPAGPGPGSQGFGPGPGSQSVSHPCSVQALNCSIGQLNAMTAQARLDWLRQFQSEWDTSGWFNAVEDILRFARDKRLVALSPWFSRVDAHILHAIQEGMAIHSGTKTQSLVGGSSEWASFFDALDQQADRYTLLRLWGTAESAATDYGIARAERIPIAPLGPERFALDDVGDIYRSLVTNAPLTEAAGGLGAGLVAASLGLACGPAAPACSTFLFATGVGGGSYLTSQAIDPRTSGFVYDMATRFYDLGAIVSP
jgi:RHS repeat-associated protein